MNRYACRAASDPTRVDVGGPNVLSPPGGVPMIFTHKLAHGLAWRKNLGAIAAAIAAAVIIACEIPGTAPGSGIARAW